MNKRMKNWAPGLLIGLCLMVSNAYAVNMQTMDGKPTSIEQFTGKGKWTIVMMWASDCLICNKEARHYDAFYMKHKDKDAVVLGLSMDGQANKKAALAFIKEHDLHFTNIIGEFEDVAVYFQDITGEQWGGTPAFLIYSPTGQLTVQQVGAVPISMLEDFLQKQAGNKL